MLECPYCGGEIEDDGLDCPHCGADLEEWLYVWKSENTVKRDVEKQRKRLYPYRVYFYRWCGPFVRVEYFCSITGGNEALYKIKVMKDRDANSSSIIDNVKFVPLIGFIILIVITLLVKIFGKIIVNKKD